MVEALAMFGKFNWEKQGQLFALEKINCCLSC